MTVDDLDLDLDPFADFTTTAKRMKIKHYCQQQRCKHVELEQFWHAFASRGFFSATAGLSCSLYCYFLVTCGRV